MKKIAILLLLLFSLESIAQSYQENLEKYWYYRQKLKTEWMYDSGNNNKGDNNVPENIGISEDCIAGFDENYLRYGDQTWLLGHYMGVLATEYRLLRANGQDVDEILNDIHKALETLERLDLTGELCFPGGTENTNGFFIRDDVPEDFVENLPDIEDISSDYRDNCPNIGLGNEMSQDQVWGLFIGLRLLKEFIDVDNYNIPQRVVNVTDLIINAMHFTNWLGFEEWVIINPVTGDDVSRGSNAKPLSWAFARVAKDITDVNQQTATSLLWKPVFEAAQKNILLQFPATPPSCFDCSAEKDRNETTMKDSSRVVHTAYGILTLTALTDHIVWMPNFPFIDAHQYLQWVNQRTIGYYNMSLGLYPHLMALNKVLHGNIVPAYGTGFYEFFLNSAPPCGAYHYRDTDDNHINSAPPWHTISLFTPQHCCAYDNVNRGHANMVDYMLLYNLYFINYIEGELPYRKITNDFPSRDSAGIISKEINAEVITAARQLDIYSNVYPTGDVTFIAGEKIRFMPGFHAYRNSHVHSYIDNSLNHEIYYNETNTDPCNGQESVCDKRSSTIVRQKLSDGIEKEIASAENVNNLNIQQDDFIIIYPNPAKDFVKVESSEIISKIAILSMDGKVFMNKTINTKTSELNIKALPPGIYLIKIQNSKKVYFERMIKR